MPFLGRDDVIVWPCAENDLSDEIAPLTNAIENTIAIAKINGVNFFMNSIPP